MPINSKSARHLAFGDFVIDRVNESVIGPEGRLRIGDKAYRVLLSLAEQDGKLVTKDALFSSVWDGVIVSESALTSAVKELRRALGDESRTPRYIESVYGRGYRLLAPVIPREEELEDSSPYSYGILLSELGEIGISKRITNALNFYGHITRVGDLVQKTEAEILRVPGIGRESLRDIKMILSRYDLRLGIDIPDMPPLIDEMGSTISAAARKVAQIRQAPLGATFEPSGDILAINASGEIDDFEAANKPIVAQLHEEIIRKSAIFSGSAARLDNQIGWHGISRLCDRLSQLLARPSQQIPDVLGLLYSAALELGSFLEMDQRIASGQDSFTPPLDPDVRRPLEDLLISLAPWLRSFPSVRQMDDEAGQFLTRNSLLQPSTEAIKTANGLQLIGADDAEVLRALLEAAERGAFQGAKAGHRGVLSVRNMIVAASGVLGTFMLGALSSDFATKSVMVQKAGDFLAQAESAVVEIVSELPQDLRLAIETMIREAQKSRPSPPADSSFPRSQENILYRGRSDIGDQT
jgi:DNA-binding winged helix-turn-helix (wHTH) protein